MEFKNYIYTHKRAFVEEGKKKVDGKTIGKLFVDGFFLSLHCMSI